MPGEVYKVVCGQCHKTVEFLAAPVGQAQIVTCPRCGARLELDWRPAEVAAR